MKKRLLCEEKSTNMIRKRIKSIACCLFFSVLILLTGCANHSEKQTPEQRAAFEKKSIHLAVQYLNSNQPLKAIARLNKYLQVDPGSAQAYGLLGVIYQRQGEYEISKRKFEKALAINPKDSAIRNNYGVLFYTTKHYKKALEQFFRVANDVYYEECDRVFQNIGTVYFEMGDTKQAVENYEHALRLNSFLNGANVRLAQIFLEKNEPKKAYVYYSNFSLTRNQSAETLWLGFQIARRLGKNKEADTYGEQLEKLYPHSPEYRRYQRLINKKASP